MMKKMFMWWLGPAVLAAGLVLVTGTTPVAAQNQERGGMEERLNRLERAVHEMALHHQQMMQQHQMHQPGAPGMQRPGENAAAGFCAVCPPMPPHPQAMHPGMPPMGPKCPLKFPCLLCGLLALAATINILLAVWIFTDIRKRGEGHGIFVALALVAGIPTAIIYALVRIGDKK